MYGNCWNLSDPNNPALLHVKNKNAKEMAVYFNALQAIKIKITFSKTTGMLDFNLI
jgi:hypothetical protein